MKTEKFKPTEKDKKIVKEANINGKIKNVTYFSNNNKDYAIVVNKVADLYAIRLINYKYGEITEIKAVKRLPDLMGFYRTKEEALYKVEEIPRNQELINQCVYKIETQEDDTENILLVGRTGSGKSTLANVLISDEFSGELKFEESAGGVSHTKSSQAENFVSEGIKYRVIDTVGLGDIKLSKKTVLYKLGEVIHTMKSGIKQILLTVDGRFTDEQIEAFNLVLKIFGNDIVEFITIVRTKFVYFEDPERCKEDKEKLKNEKKLNEMINSCNDIIYVDNPPLHKNVEENKKDRSKSRKVLLEHLASCQESYKLENWDKICVRINDYMNARQWKQGIKELEKAKEKVIKEVEVEIKLEIPTVANLQIFTKSKGVDCCSIL